MVKNTMRIGLVSLLAVAMLLGATTVVHADGGDNADAVIDISIKGDPKVEIAARGACEVKVKREGSSEANPVAIFISPNPVVYTDGSEGNTGAVVDISISGASEVNIAIRGTCEVNVRVEGPAKVNIEAGDEVRLNVEPSDESQVFVDDQSLDNPAQSPSDPSATDQDSKDVDEHSSGLDNLAIISGAFLAVGLPAFLLVRRKAKRAKAC